MAAPATAITSESISKKEKRESHFPEDTPNIVYVRLSYMATPSLGLAEKCFYSRRAYAWLKIGNSSGKG